MNQHAATVADVVDYPLGMRLVVDAGTTQLPDGALLGGSPRRLLRLSPAGQRAYRDLQAGPVRTPTQATLARRLTDAGVLHPAPPPTAAVSATVLIPVRDRPAELARCLASLGSEHAVVVVDDASEQPGTVAKVCAEHGARYLARPVNGGPAAARNSGLAVIDTEFVLLLDSDCIPPTGLITALAGHFADPAVAAVAPRVLGDTAYRSPLDLGDRPANVAPGRAVSYVPTAALLARRAALPPFDEQLRFGEDVDVIWQLVSAGHRVRYEPRVLVTHREPPSRRDLLRRRFCYGSSAAPLAARHPGALAPLVVHPASMLVAAAVLGRRPSLAVIGAVWSYRQLRSLPSGTHRAALVARSAWWSWLGLSRYATQFAPLLVARAARRRPTFALLLLSAPLTDWWQHRPLRSRQPGARRIGPVRFTAAQLADDAAYGTGVIAGCLRARRVHPLLPVRSSAGKTTTAPAGSAR